VGVRLQGESGRRRDGLGCRHDRVRGDARDHRRGDVAREARVPERAALRERAQTDRAVTIGCGGTRSDVEPVNRAISARVRGEGREQASVGGPSAPSASTVRSRSR
jgi:hypothetical protein